MLLINSQIEKVEVFPFTFTQEQVKNEPMLFNCDKEYAYKLGGQITHKFLMSLSEEFHDSPDLVIDSRVHMLMPNWWPAISGFHHDDVPRTRIDGQPNYENPEYKSKHCMLLVGKASKTNFAIGKADFPEVPIGQKCYQVWHPVVREKIAKSELSLVTADFNKMYYFDWQTWHEATPAYENGWRFFIRASINTNRKPTNEIRKQTQVYLANPYEGW